MNMNNVQNGENIMLKTVMTLFRASSTATEEALIDANAVLLLQQHIKDAETSIDGSKRALATLIMEKKTLTVSIDNHAKQADQYKKDAEKALDAGKEDLALMAAEMLADCEQKKEDTQQRVSTLDTQILKLRHKIQSQKDRLGDLKLGLQKARHNQQDEFVLRLLSAKDAPSSALRKGEKLLERLENRGDPNDLLEEVESIENEVNKSDYENAFDEAGIGQGRKARAADLLAEIKASQTK